MKKPLILTFLIFIGAFVFGQDLGNFKIVDTLKIIKSRHLPDQRIRYINEDYEFQFSKRVCIKVIDKQLESLESDLEDNYNSSYIKEKKLKDINKYKIVRCYIMSQDSLKLKKPFFDESVDNSLELADSLFNFIAPSMLDAGKFKLFLNGKQQRTIIKENVRSGNDYTTQIESRYISENGKEVWTGNWIIRYSTPNKSLYRKKTNGEIKPMELPTPEK